MEGVWLEYHKKRLGTFWLDGKYSRDPRSRVAIKTTTFEVGPEDIVGRYLNPYRFYKEQVIDEGSEDDHVPSLENVCRGRDDMFILEQIGPGYFKALIFIERRLSVSEISIANHGCGGSVLVELGSGHGGVCSSFEEYFTRFGPKNVDGIVVDSDLSAILSNGSNRGMVNVTHHSGKEVTDDVLRTVENAFDSMSRSRYDNYRFIRQFADLMEKYGFRDRLIWPPVSQVETRHTDTSKDWLQYIKSFFRKPM